MAKSESVKVTYSLPEDLVNELREVVREGPAPSYSAFVETALRRAVDEEKERRLAAEFAAAAEDPGFISDLEETQADFNVADAETAREIP